ncbi:MAG: hypothetical protein M0037_01285 [Betaproteobacteria bacterium]|nr:hypothetical protein [Betaproteobacteria bacterium]
MRVKTSWFNEGGERDASETASVLASTIWRLADAAIIDLSKANYDIVTPERGITLMAEFIAFLAHVSDRLSAQHLDDEARAALIQALGLRLGEIMEDNVRTLVQDDGRDFRAEFIDMLNRRAADYATFALASEPSFPMLRFLGLKIRERMESHDQPWIMDQIADIEAPKAFETVKRTVDGLLGGVS